MPEEAPARRRLDVGLALRRATSLARASLLACLPLSLIFAAAQMIGVAGVGMQRTNPAGWLLYLVAAVTSAASGVAIVNLQREIVAGRVVRPFAAWRTSWSAVPVWLVTGLVSGALAASIIVVTRSGGGASETIAALIAVPAAVLAVSLQLAVPVALIERHGTIATLLRSHRLVWGNWWRVLAAIATLLLLLVSALLGVVVLLAFIAAIFAGDAGAAGRYGPVQALMYLVIGITAVPAWSALTLAMYSQLAAPPPAAQPPSASSSD